MQGPLAELAISQDLFARGWYVFRALGAMCPFDLVAYKDDSLLKIEVKTGRRWPAGSHSRPLCKNLKHDILALYLANTKEIIYDPPLP